MLLIILKLKKIMVTVNLLSLLVHVFMIIALIGEYVANCDKLEKTIK